jgi:hypothetical protein
LPHSLLTRRHGNHTDDAPESRMRHPRCQPCRFGLRQSELVRLPIHDRFARHRYGRNDFGTTHKIARPDCRSSCKQLSSEGQGASTATSFLFRLHTPIWKGSALCSPPCVVCVGFLQLFPHSKCKIHIAASVILRFIAGRKGRKVRVDKLCLCPTAQPPAARSAKDACKGASRPR